MGYIWIAICISFSKMLWVLSTVTKFYNDRGSHQKKLLWECLKSFMRNKELVDICIFSMSMFISHLSSSFEINFRKFLYLFKFNMKILRFNRIQNLFYHEKIFTIKNVNHNIIGSLGWKIQVFNHFTFNKTVSEYF